MKATDIHWLLELMVIDPVPLAWILPSFNRQHTNALPISNYTPMDYAQLLIAALDGGLIELLSNYNGLKLSVENAKNAITRFCHERPQEDADHTVHIRMTTTGGNEWESLAEPVWDRFFKFLLTFLSSDEDDLRVSGLLASKNRDVVIAYLGWYESLESVDVRWDTLTITSHAEYEATYWKLLTDVYEAKFDGVHQTADRSVPPPVWDWRMALNNWHLKPWDRPDWS